MTLLRIRCSIALSSVGTASHVQLFIVAVIVFQCGGLANSSDRLRKVDLSPLAFSYPPTRNHGQNCTSGVLQNALNLTLTSNLTKPTTNRARYNTQRHSPKRMFKYGVDFALAGARWQSASVTQTKYHLGEVTSAVSPADHCYIPPGQFHPKSLASLLFCSCGLYHRFLRLGVQ
eukprot:6463614-Amphidinium_carterae.1